MPELIICRGVPGSGKSTYAQAWVKAGQNRVRINRDDLRKMLFDKFWGLDEDFVTVVADSIFYDAVMEKKSIIIDNTNIKPADFRGFLDVARANGYDIFIKLFDVPLHVAQERNASRSRQVPPEVIEKMFNKLMEIGPLDVSDL